MDPTLEPHLKLILFIRTTQLFFFIKPINQLYSLKRKLLNDLNDFCCELAPSELNLIKLELRPKSLVSRRIFFFLYSE